MARAGSKRTGRREAIVGDKLLFLRLHPDPATLKAAGPRGLGIAPE